MPSDVPPTPGPSYDVIVVGGGPAGLSAALMLGRCRRRVLLVDSNQPRNAVSRGLHGYLTQDGVTPQELRRRGQENVRAYPTITMRAGEVASARRESTGFSIRLAAGGAAAARFLLLATGRADPLPEKAGFREFYGRGVYHCPYCDGWEHCDQALAVFGGSRRAHDLAALLLTWSAQVTWFTDGWSPPPDCGLPSDPRVRLMTDEVLRLEGDARGNLNRVVFAATGKHEPCDALFFCSPCVQRSLLPAALGCRFDGDEAVVCDGFVATGVPGLYLAGNVRGGVHLAIIAAGEGAEAAMAINEALGEVGAPSEQARGSSAAVGT